jgi:glycosyltransferase involved in cell wall biosynthesis
MARSPRLCLIPRIPGAAGPANFQRRLEGGLAGRGIAVTYDPEEDEIDAALVVGGTRHLGSLRRLRRRGIPIFQRLNGMNWLHRRRRTGLRHFVRAEVNNLLLRTIRDRLARGVIYQSAFARRWWEGRYGAAPARADVIHNGVPLDLFHPRGPEQPPEGATRILVVEGNLAGGYEHGLESAFALGGRLQERLGSPVEVAVAGRAPQSVQRAWEGHGRAAIRWLGLISPAEIPALDRGAHLLYAADLNPACPNSVIEALGCGLPVVAFDTGALPELVTGDSGRLAPYGGDPWRLDPPDLGALTEAALEVMRDPAKFRRGARARAEAGLGLDTMVESYRTALGWIG